MMIALFPICGDDKNAVDFLLLNKSVESKTGSSYRLSSDDEEKMSNKDTSFSLKLVVEEAGTEGTNKATLALQHSPDADVWYPLDSISSTNNTNGIFTKPIGGSATMFRYVRGVLTVNGNCKATTHVLGASVGRIKATKIK